MIIQEWCFVTAERQLMPSLDNIHNISHVMIPWVSFFDVEAHITDLRTYAEETKMDVFACSICSILFEWNEWRRVRSQRNTNSSYIAFNSSGSAAFGCLFSKCCLYVLGSGIWACKNNYQIRKLYIIGYAHNLSIISISEKS